MSTLDVPMDLKLMRRIIKEQQLDISTTGAGRTLQALHDDIVKQLSAKSPRISLPNRPGTVSRHVEALYRCLIDSEVPIGRRIASR